MENEKQSTDPIIKREIQIHENAYRKGVYHGANAAATLLDSTSPLTETRKRLNQFCNISRNFYCNKIPTLSLIDDIFRQMRTKGRIPRARDKH